MVSTGLSVGTKTIVTAIMSMIILAMIVPLGWGEEEPAVNRKGCVFARFLENPDFRVRYRQSLSNARIYGEENSYDSKAMYGAIVKASVNSEDGKDLGALDSFSTGCVSCHNGIVSPQEMLNFKNNPESRMQMLSGKHPIGMDYGRYAAANSNLRKLNELNPGLVLVGGKVSCVTCHDALNPGKNHMALNDSGRDLCMECHNL